MGAVRARSCSIASHNASSERKERRVDAGFAGKQRSDAIEVQARQLVESLARTRTDGGNSDLHALSVREVRFRHENCETRAPRWPLFPCLY